MQRPLFASLEEEGLSDFRFDLQKKLFRNNCPPTRFFFNCEKKTTIKSSIGSKKDRRESGLFQSRANYFVFRASLKSFPATNFG